MCLAPDFITRNAVSRSSLLALKPLLQDTTKHVTKAIFIHPRCLVLQSGNVASIYHKMG
jgi:hypothetical protein